MSYCFNYGGYEFKQNEYGTTSSGGDGKFYIFRVKDFKSFLDDKYSKNKYYKQEVIPGVAAPRNYFQKIPERYKK